MLEISDHCSWWLALYICTRAEARYTIPALLDSPEPMGMRFYKFWGDTSFNEITRAEYFKALVLFSAGPLRTDYGFHSPDGAAFYLCVGEGTQRPPSPRKL